MASHGMNQNLRQKMSQEMQLLPKMLQSLDVLQLALGELDTFLEEAALENEALDFREQGPAETPVDGVSRARGTEASDRHEAWLESQPEPDSSPLEVLTRELSLLRLEPELEDWARLVISCLDPRGYLSVPDETLFELGRERGLMPDAGLLGAAIAVVQGLEPRGIGGRDVVEALLLQLDPLEESYQLLCRLVEEFLEDVARNKLPAVARSLGIEVEELKGLLVRLRELDPVPGAALGGTSPPAIRPDVVVERVEATEEEESGKRAARREYRVRIEDSHLPAVTLNEEVGRIVTDPDQPKRVRRYLRDKMDRARWLLEAIAQRQETLLQVATWIFDRQRGFLERGAGSIRPLTMTEAAGDLGIHLSTVSRAVAGKYVSTPSGIHSLRSFFQATAGENEGVSRGSVQEVLRGIVEAEDKARPFSDDELVARLGEEGYQIARRTVSKYRRELGIESSYRRRAY